MGEDLLAQVVWELCKQCAEAVQGSGGGGRVGDDEIDRLTHGRILAASSSDIFTP
jgi:hypothetical protein